MSPSGSSRVKQQRRQQQQQRPQTQQSVCSCIVADHDSHCPPVCPCFLIPSSCFAAALAAVFSVPWPAGSGNSTPLNGISNFITIVAEAMFLYGWRPASNAHSQGKEELHLFRCLSVPESVKNSLLDAAGFGGHIPRRNTAGYIRKGTDQNWANWAWQEKENGAVTWWTGLDLAHDYVEVKFYQVLFL